MNSKKIILLAISILLLVGLVGCNSKPENVGDQAYNSGKRAIEIVDQYLNGKIGKNEAKSELSKIDFETDTVEESSIYRTILNLSYHFGAGSSDSVILNVRNDLAEKLNLKKK